MGIIFIIIDYICYCLKCDGGTHYKEIINIQYAEYQEDIQFIRIIQGSCKR